MKAVFLGIDLTSSSKRASAYAVLDDQAKLHDVGLVGEDVEIVALAQRWRPRYVAIDAPISLPRGLCCLDESCDCAPVSGDGLKAAERELFRRGVGLYATTKRSMIKAMVYRAMELRRSLERVGFSVVEIYPYASKVQLFGKPVPKKTTAAGRQWLRERLEGLVPGLGEREGRLSHDELDAVVAAYTAYLHGRGLAEEVGDPEEGMIVVPRGQSLS